MPAAVTVDVFANVACPRCLIGWRRLQRAAALLEGEVTLHIHWLPMGPNRKASKSADDLLRAASEEGIVFDRDRLKSRPDTTDAQRLLLMAQQEGKATALQERLFADHFEDGRDLGDHEVLCDAAEAVGIGRRKAEAFLRSSDGRKAVGALEAEARALGVTEAPALVVNEELTVIGLQPVEVVVATLREAVRLEDAADV